MCIRDSYDTENRNAECSWTIHSVHHLILHRRFFLIPVFAGFSHIYAKKLNKKNLVNFFLILSFISTIYYHQKYINKRDTLLLRKLDLSQSVDAGILSNKLKNLRWLTHHYPNNPETEIKNLLNNGSEKIRVGIKPEGKVIARENVKIFSSDDKEIGLVTSGTFGPSVNAPVAMGYIKSNFAKVGTSIKLEVRGKKYEGKVSELPFYKKSYVK